MTAGENLLVKRERLWVAVTGAPGIGCAHSEAIDIGTVEWRRIDRGNDVTGKHAGTNICQRY